MKMEKKNIKFGDIETKKQKLYQHNSLISIDYININKIFVSNKVSFGRKCLHIPMAIKMLKN